MKRAREEQEEGEEDQEQDATAPMAAASPARNPGPADDASSFISTGDDDDADEDDDDGRVMTMDDAVQFVKSVQRALDRTKYRKFLTVVRQIHSIGPKGILDGMKVLLRGHPDLKRHFNRFVPVEYELSLSDDDDDQQEEAPAADGLQGEGPPSVIDD